MKAKLPINNGKEINTKYNGLPIPYEPKRNNRWVVKFLDAYSKIPIYSVYKTHRPKLINGSWGEITMLLRDAIGPSTAQGLNEGILNEWQNVGRCLPKIKYFLEILDPVGHTIEKWNIEGNLIEVDFGDLDVADDGLITIKLKIEPTKVILLY